MYLILMKIKVTHSLLILTMLFSAEALARFPEFGFCPLGGPPGWFNRISGQTHRHRVLMPVYPAQMSPVPYYAGYAYPVPPRYTGYGFNPPMQHIDQR